MKMEREKMEGEDEEKKKCGIRRRGKLCLLKVGGKNTARPAKPRLSPPTGRCRRAGQVTPSHYAAESAAYPLYPASTSLGPDTLRVRRDAPREQSEDGWR